MARRDIQFLPENFYHIYNRGNNRQEIFLDDENYRFFLKRLNHYFNPIDIETVAYCLLPNHFHLLIYLHAECSFSKIMRSFSDSYVRSFNIWHKRSGHLFEGDFQARHIKEGKHLTYLCGYIHLNPVAAGLVLNPEEWEFSDYRNWLCVDIPIGSVKSRLLMTVTS